MVSNNPQRREEDKLPPPTVVTSATLKMGKDIRKQLSILTTATVILALGLGGLTGWSWVQSQKNTEALCALHDQSYLRAEANAKFLTENPKGIPGIKVEDIQASINQSRAVVRSLSELNCGIPSKEAT